MSETSELIAKQILNGNINKRTWGDIMFNPKVYGGARGDGLTDDSVAIQKTIDAAEGTGWVVVPPGDYRILSKLNITSHFDAKQATFYTAGSLDSASSIVPDVFTIVNGKDVWLPTLVKGGVTTPAYHYNLTQLTFTVPQISKNGGLIDQTYLTDDLKQMIAGTAPINAVPADESITPNKTSFMKSVINLFNPAAAVLGIVHSGDGTIVASSDWYASDYIPAVNGKTYKATACADYAFYNSSHVFISGVSKPWSTAIETITPPSGTAYVRFTVRVVDLSTTMLVQDELPVEYLPYGSYSIDITDPHFREAINNSLSNTSKWTGKTWNAVGDSLTEHNFTTTKNYQDIIAEKIDCNVNNYGISGTGWFTDWMGNAAFYNRLGALSTSADLITVFGGTNDWGETGKPLVLGSFGDTNPATTFYGAVDYTIRQLVTLFPTKTIAVFTPVPRNNNWGTSSTGVTLEQVADAIIKVCRKYSIPVLDLYRESNVYAWDANYRTYALPDGLHPNDNGHASLADKILTFLNSL